MDPPDEATTAELQAALAHVQSAVANLDIDNEAPPPVFRPLSALLGPVLQGLSSAALVRLADDIGTGQRGASSYVVTMIKEASESDPVLIDRVVDLLAAVDVDAEDEAGHTLLCAACQMNAEYAVRILVERIGAGPDLSDERNKRPLDFAASHSNLEIAKILIAAGAEVTHQVVLVACARGHVNFMRWLLSQGHCDVPLEPTGRELLKSVAGLGLAFEDRGETVQKWQWRAEKGLTFLLHVQAAGSYANYFAEPRYELVLLRALCLSGRAKSRHEQLFKWMETTPPTLQTASLSGKKRARPKPTSVRCYYLATRLFGVGQARELPVGCFATILDYWWRG